MVVSDISSCSSSNSNFSSIVISNNRIANGSRNINSKKKIVRVVEVGLIYFFLISY